MSALLVLFVLLISVNMCCWIEMIYIILPNKYARVISIKNKQIKKD